MQKYLDEIAERSITYWAAVDWLSQFGHDPDRIRTILEEWKGTLIPEEFWGHYDAPGLDGKWSSSLGFAVRSDRSGWQLIL